MIDVISTWKFNTVYVNEFFFSITVFPWWKFGISSGIASPQFQYGYVCVEDFIYARAIDNAFVGVSISKVSMLSVNAKIFAFELKINWNEIDRFLLVVFFPTNSCLIQWVWVFSSRFVVEKKFSLSAQFKRIWSNHIGYKIWRSENVLHNSHTLFVVHKIETGRHIIRILGNCCISLQYCNSGYWQQRANVSIVKCVNN